MKTFMRYACPLMMLGFPTLIFAADTLRQLNAKSKGVLPSQVMQREMNNIGAVCGSKVAGVTVLGDIYSSGEHFYRCVTIFDGRYQPIGSAWVEVRRSQDELALHIE